MRDLEKQIADWRRTMAKASGRSHELLDELEEHLRDEIDRLLRTGTSTDDVFQLAVSNLGSPSALAAEFEKLALSRRAKWKPVTIAQILCIAAAVLSAVALITRIGTGRMGLLLASHVLAVTVGYGTMFIMGGLGICYVLARWFRQDGPAQRTAFQRAIFQFASLSFALTTVGVVLGMFWAKDNWDRYWAWDPKENGALLVLGCAAITIALRWVKPANHSTIAFMSIVGNIGTAWAWFGANAAWQPSPALIAFTAVHLLALVLAMRVGNGLITKHQ